MENSIPKPAHLGAKYAAQFEDPSVAAAYFARAPYHPEFFDVLRGLQAGGPGWILELGSGTGDATLGLLDCVERIDAIEPSAQMLAIARKRPGAEDPRIRWIHNFAEDAQLAGPYSLAIDDLKGMVDFVLAAAVVHEMPSADAFFREAAAAMASGGRLLFAEPAGHVSDAKFAEELDSARRAGLVISDRPTVKRFQAAVLGKQAA